MLTRGGFPLFPLILCALTSLPGIAPGAISKSEVAVVRFSESVANVEYESQEFASTPFRGIRSLPRSQTADLRFGRIKRRYPGDTPSSPRRDVPMAAAYVNGLPVSFWCDLNLDGELADEKPIALYHFPGSPGARAALVDLKWKVKLAADSIPISWKIRVVLDPVTLPDSLPRYRLQKIYAETGKIYLDGQLRSAFLYDGSNDGVYSKDFADGLFIDSNGDGEVTVDTSSPEFLPFRVPTQVGSTLFETLRVDPRGSDVELRAITGQREQGQATVGDPAPDFTFESLEGKHVGLSDYRGRPVIVYFWASWCGACVEQAPKLRAVYNRLHPRGLSILAVSFDHDRASLMAFESKHAEPWPISYVGREFWENPVGRLYGVSAAGAAYLVDGEGKFLGLYYDLEDLEEKAATLLPQ